MKVSNWVHFTKIWVTIATKWRHAPFYRRPNTLPPEIISEIRRRGLGLDIVASTDGNIVQSIRAFSRKLRAKFQCVKIQQKQSCFICYCKLCPQDWTKWHSGPVVRKPINVNPGLNLNWSIIFIYLKMLLTLTFGVVWDYYSLELKGKQWKPIT